MVNVIIPCAGEGRRFKEAGYDLPKPLINVLGDPLICKVIDSITSDNIYIVYHQSLDKYLFRHILKKRFPKLNFLPLSFHTRGPAETVLCGLNKINSDNPVLVLDCDTIYNDDITSMAGGDTIFYFKDTQPDPMFSYIKIEGSVTEIKEKVKISDNACSGAYSFKSGFILKDYCEEILNNEEKSAGEYYMSNVYQRMIADGHKISAKEVSFHCLGTPVQLQSYCLQEPQERKRICFDLDNTLVTYPEKQGDYTTVLPIDKNIKMLRYLYEQGHTIIINTARRMKSSGNNPGRAVRNGYKDLFQTLEKYNIPFDEIYFKPHADFYIDDLSCKPYNIEKETGFYYDRVEPRRFNRIRYEGDYVIKTTNNSGEIYFYKNIPEKIKKYFPEVEISGNEIKMERITGVSFSYLLCNGSLTSKNINLLFEAVEEIHKQEAPGRVDLMANYYDKILRRYKEYDYSVVGDDGKYFDLIIPHHEPQPGVIHGDMVFSNIFLCDNRIIKFIDMRGKVGKVDTILGDKYYDFAKIYQSLMGYDFILNGIEINEPYLTELRYYYESFFGDKDLSIIKHITAGLLFSLIPLHDDSDKQRKYFNLMQCLIP